MSDDDDDRMERAERIRNLREGRRGGDRGAEDTSTPDGGNDGDEDASTADGGTDGGEDASTADSGNDARGTEDTDQVAEDDGEESEAAETTDTAAEADGDASETVDNDTDRTAGDDGEDTATTDQGADDGDDPDEGAIAAAAAAAEAASEFEGDIETVGGSETETPQPGAGSADDGGTAAAAAGVAEGVSTEADAETTRVLEFRLGEELYCLDIEYVEEIVREETVTRVPNTPEYVNGVVDLRGQITTILDPKVPAGIESDTDEQLILVFDGETFEDYGYIGWLVDEVNQVTAITEADVKDSPIQEPYINGVIERDDEFVIWTTPELALDIDEE